MEALGLGEDGGVEGDNGDERLDGELDGVLGEELDAMKAPILGTKREGQIGKDQSDGEGDDDVEALQEMLLKMQAIRGENCFFSGLRLMLQLLEHM